MMSQTTLCNPSATPIGHPPANPTLDLLRAPDMIGRYHASIQDEQSAFEGRKTSFAPQNCLRLGRLVQSTLLRWLIIQLHTVAIDVWMFSSSFSEILPSSSEHNLPMMADPSPLESTDVTRSATGSAQISPTICAECRKLDFDFLEAHPGSTRLVRVHRGADCECCRFLWTSLEIRGAIPDADFAQETVNDIQIRCAERKSGGFRAGRLVVSIAGEWNIARRSVLLHLEPSVNVQQAMPHFQPIHPTSIDYDLLRSWIQDCQQNHVGPCIHTQIRSATPSPNIPGFKVIDCLEMSVKEQTISAISFLALSYVWGQLPQEAARGKSQYDVRDGKLPAILPATIADAISVTIQLGHRYLWVDRYCINQHDAGEVHSQISMMDVIYHEASITIIAAAGHNSNHGLPGVGTRLKNAQNIITMNKGNWVSTPANLKSLVKSSQWHSRGWTLVFKKSSMQSFS